MVGVAVTEHERQQLRARIDAAAKERLERDRYCPSCATWRPHAEFGRDECLACRSITNAIAYERRKATA